LDHTCENKACVNPNHLRATSNRVNVLLGNGACAKHARQRYCKRGHRLYGDNLFLDKKAYRQCRVCDRAAKRRYEFKRENGLSSDDCVVWWAIACSLWAREALAL